LELLWLSVAAAIGCMLVYRFGGLGNLSPRWAAAVLIWGTGVAAGIGLTSILFFLCELLVPGFPLLPKIAEIVLAVSLGALIYRDRGEPDRSKTAAGKARAMAFRWNRVLAAALLLILVIGGIAISRFWEANPQGNWDAWAIWNLRARFLAAGGQLAERAWSPSLTNTHPEYPLLLSSFVARCWSYSGSTSALAPAATAYAFFLALAAIGAGGIAAMWGESLGLLFGLVLASSPFVLQEIPAQYSDLPLACYFAGALVLLLVSRPMAAGLFASLAAWTKDEGLLFFAVFLAVILFARRPQFWRTIAAAAPVGALAIFFKMFLARGTSSLLGQSIHSAGWLPRLVDSGRYQTVVLATVEELWNMRLGWYHPVLPLIVIALALRFKPNWRRDMLAAGAVTVAMLAGYFAIYILTPNDLNWQLQTSVDRLTVQLWPLALITMFAGLRAAEKTTLEPVEEVAAVQGKASRKRKSGGA
jgi:hypothetical protein